MIIIRLVRHFKYNFLEVKPIFLYFILFIVPLEKRNQIIKYICEINTHLKHMTLINTIKT